MFIRMCGQLLDAFLQDWRGQKAYANPQWNLIGRVLKKVEEQAVDLVLVAPVWPSQPWYPKLLSLLIAQPLRILDPPEEVPHQVWEGLLPEITPPLAVWHISGNTKQTREFQEKQQISSCLHGIRNHPSHMIHSVKNESAGILNGVLIPFQDL